MVTYHWSIIILTYLYYIEFIFDFKEYRKVFFWLDFMFGQWSVNIIPQTNGLASRTQRNLRTIRRLRHNPNNPPPPQTQLSHLHLPRPQLLQIPQPKTQSKIFHPNPRLILTPHPLRPKLPPLPWPIPQTHVIPRSTGHKINTVVLLQRTL
jgi:hypothetical protein